MKSFLFLLALVSSQVFAIEINSKDLEKIQAKVQRSHTGQKFTLKLSKSNASCSINTMAQQPGYECLLLGKNRADNLHLSDKDVEAIQEAALMTVTSDQFMVLLSSSEIVSCRVNSMAQLPGFSCKH